MVLFSRTVSAAVVLLLLLLSSCASPPRQTLQDHALVYSAYTANERLRKFAPVFVVEEAGIPHNRIGKVAAVVENDKETVFVDPERSAVYFSTKTFSTERGSYTNLLYRIHFSEIPSGFVPFYLGAGKNVGLIVIATLDDKDRVLLYTLVHTCGCYLAFIPTTHLPKESWPPGWSPERQYVYGEYLPGLLSPTEAGEELFTVLVRTATHRVKDVWLGSTEDLENYSIVTPEFLPFEALERIPISTSLSTSFFETDGPRRGYVKGSQKLWERLLISWWALDWRVGEDKKLGRDKDDGITFYTSLKPWARQESDLRDFPGFLRYWGWRF